MYIQYMFEMCLCSHGTLFFTINVMSRNCNLAKPISTNKTTLASSHLLCHHSPPCATRHPRIVGRERRIVSTLKQVRELTAALERMTRVLAEGSEKANHAHITGDVI